MKEKSNERLKWKGRRKEEENYREKVMKVQKWEQTK